MAEDEGYVLRLWRTANGVLVDRQDWLTNWELAVALLDDEDAAGLIAGRRAEIRSDGRDPKSAAWMAWNAVSWFSASLWSTGEAVGSRIASGAKRNPSASKSDWPRSYAPATCTSEPPSKRETKERNRAAQSLADSFEVEGKLASIDPEEIVAIKDYAEDWARRWLLADGWTPGQISPPRPRGEDYICRAPDRVLSVEVKGTKASEPVFTIRESQIHRAELDPEQNALFVVYGIDTERDAEGRWQCSGGTPIYQRPFHPDRRFLAAKEYECHVPLDSYTPVYGAAGDPPTRPS